MATIAFFGTPIFAAPALRALINYAKRAGHDLSMVVTQPDKAQGRGQKISEPPIKTIAKEFGIRVFQPETLRKNTEEGDEFFETFKNARIDLAIVVAYGKLIPKRFLKCVNGYFVNIHASLLPRFRGAAPIQRAILSGDKESGVCLMEVVEKLDQGDVFACLKTPIIASDTSETLFLRLSHLGAHLLEEKLNDLLTGNINKNPQTDEGVIYAPMIDKHEGALSFDEPGALIVFKTRAFDPWPGTYALLHNKRVRLFDAFFIKSSKHSSISPGTIVVAKNFLGVKALDGIVYFQRIQVEGKKALSIQEAILGFNIKVKDKIETLVA